MAEKKKKLTRESAGINVCSELLARMTELECISDHDLETFKSIVLLSFPGKVCYTGIVTQIIAMLDELFVKHNEAIESDETSWVFWNEEKLKTNAEKFLRNLKLKVNPFLKPEQRYTV